MNKIYFCFLLSVLECLHNYANVMIVFLVFYHALVKNKNCFRERKSFCFQQDQTTITQEDPKGFTWHKH